MNEKVIIKQIHNTLHEIEERENVQIIFAIESGSRAWGFASPDSDFDVRFIYVRKPEEYIRLNPVRDVIEWQLDEVYDISGWDLQKALRLMHDSNPALHEWCKSPIIYVENEFAQQIRELALECFLPKKSVYHYVNMARKTYNEHLNHDKINFKKYFYALRPILAAKWIVDHNTVPPMAFLELMEAELEMKMIPIVQDLLNMKKSSSEASTGSPITELNDYIRKNIEVLQSKADELETQRNSWDKLEAFFRKIVLR